MPGAPALVRMGVPGAAAFCAVAVLPAGVAAPLTGVDGADPGACGDSLTFSQSRESERRQDEPKGRGSTYTFAERLVVFFEQVPRRVVPRLFLDLFHLVLLLLDEVFERLFCSAPFDFRVSSTSP